MIDQVTYLQRAARRGRDGRRRAVRRGVRRQGRQPGRDGQPARRARRVRRLRRRRRLRRADARAPRARRASTSAHCAAARRPAAWRRSGSSRTAPTGSSSSPAPTRSSTADDAARPSPVAAEVDVVVGQLEIPQAAPRPACWPGATRARPRCSTRRRTSPWPTACWPPPTGWCPTRSSSHELAVRGPVGRPADRARRRPACWRWPRPRVAGRGHARPAGGLTVDGTCAGRPRHGSRPSTPPVPATASSARSWSHWREGATRAGGDAGLPLRGLERAARRDADLVTASDEAPSCAPSCRAGRAADRRSGRGDQAVATTRRDTGRLATGGLARSASATRSETWLSTSDSGSSSAPQIEASSSEEASFWPRSTSLR